MVSVPSTLESSTGVIVMYAVPDEDDNVSVVPERVAVPVGATEAV